MPARSGLPRVGTGTGTRAGRSFWLRLLPTLLVSGLIVATAAAFAVTEGLKLQHSPITNTHVAKVFSPLCKCSTAAASIAFRLRSADRVTVAIERGGKVVQTLVRAHAARRGWFRVRWLGRDSAGRPFPDGSYMPRVHLRRAHRTIVLPNPIVLDTAPPRLSVGHFFPALLTPDHNRIHERFEVRYHVNEPAHVSLYVDGKARFFSRFTNLDDKARWFGKVGGRGVPAGAYAITLEARDLAGNLSKAARVTTLQVRYVRLRRNVIRSRAGALFSARVLTDAPRVLWRLGARHGAGPPNLVLRAPSRKGSYRLAIRVGDHSASGLLIVRPRG